MQRTPVITVLEDQEIRVKWLEETFDADILCEDEVCKFLEVQQEEEKEGNLVLSILDHDLGLSQYGRGIEDIIEAISTPTDVEGLTGMDAALTMLTRKPVIIWTANAAVQKPMHDALITRGIQACIIPVYDKGSLEVVIRELIRDFNQRNANGD